MGFVLEKYGGENVGLSVAFRNVEQNSPVYFTGDSIKEAMDYFGVYLKGTQMFIKTEERMAIDDLKIEPNDSKEFRDAVDSLIERLSPEEAEKSAVLFPIWDGNGAVYVQNKIVRYEDKLYKILQSHTSQPTWTPKVATALFGRLVKDPLGKEVLEWARPAPPDSYSMGDKVTFKGKTYESAIEPNTYSPEEYPLGWREVIVEETV